MRQSEDKMNVVWKEIFERKLNNDIVIIGNSRGWRHYSPAILDSILYTNSYNLGIDGRGINSQILRYHTYQRLNTKPRLIIQNIDAFTIAPDNAFDREQFFPYFDDKKFRDEVVEIEQLGIGDKYIPGFRYAGYLHKILVCMGVKNKRTEHLIRGYNGHDAKWDGTMYNQITGTVEYVHDFVSLNHFDKYLQQAKNDSIKIVFVYSPLYIGVTKKINNIEGMYAMYDSIAKKYDIPILDYNYDSLSYDTTFFYNATHLNKIGAELFSAKLAHAIDSLGILK
jgi:hypothetical protein